MSHRPVRLNRPRASTARCARRFHVALACIGAVSLPMPALAYWQLIPQVDAGITYEDNPRYLSDEQKKAQDALSPGSADAVLGTFVDVRLEGSWQTPTSQIRLTPRLRSTNYLESNDDLDDDNKYVDFSATHAGQLGNVGLTAYYRDTGVRTSEFEEATPINPDLPPDISSGSGRFSDRTEETWTIGPSLSYRLSPRNQVNLNATYQDTSFHQSGPTRPIFRDYLDYDYSSVELSVRHTLNDRNMVSIGLNGGNFLAQSADGPFQNSSDSFGITAVYEHIFSERLSGDVNVGTNRSSVNVSGVVGGFDPISGAFCSLFRPCTIHNEEQNVVGSLGLRWRAELTTLNFSLSRNIAPRSDGTEVVQDQLRFYIDRTVTRRLNGSFAVVALQESAVGQVFQPTSNTFQLARQDRTYASFDFNVYWRMTQTMTAYVAYTHRLDRTDVTSGNVDKDNDRLFLGVKYRGVGLRR